MFFIIKSNFRTMSHVHTYFTISYYSASSLQYWHFEQCISMEFSFLLDFQYFFFFILHAQTTLRLAVMSSWSYRQGKKKLYAPVPGWLSLNNCNYKCSVILCTSNYCKIEIFDIDHSQVCYAVHSIQNKWEKTWDIYLGISDFVF